MHGGLCVSYNIFRLGIPLWPGCNANARAHKDLLPVELKSRAQYIRCYPLGEFLSIRDLLDVIQKNQILVLSQPDDDILRTQATAHPPGYIHQ